MNHKQQLRSEALARRKALGTDERQASSEVIVQSLEAYLQQLEARPDCLLSYRALASEVDADAVFRLQGYQAFAPVTHHHEHMEWHRITGESQWRQGLFGVLEPVGGDIWQGGLGSSVLICPLSAFDRQGNRLGMGKGCFDYWLAENRPHIDRVIGLAFSCQEVAAIPVEGHDVPMDCVITERERIECRRP